MDKKIEEIQAREQKTTLGPWEYDDSQVFVSQSQTLIANTWFGDAEFIAHAREDIPFLLEYISTLQAENESKNHEIEQSKKERDAAIDDLKMTVTHKLSKCNTCLHSKKWDNCESCEGMKHAPNWKWRGKDGF